MKSDGTNQRRYFLKKLAYTGLGGVITHQVIADGLASENLFYQSDKRYTFLFQGDSITDGNRSRDDDWNHLMGHGYAYLIASRLWFDYPKEELFFVNRGISGDKVTDLSSRWQEDTLAIQPDVLSILIGINDVEKAIEGDTSFSAESYEREYRALLAQTKKALPGVTLILCEPFILPVGRVKESFKLYQEEVKKRQVVVKKLASIYQAVFVSLQAAFNEALSSAPAEYWVWDGIHPMPAGHELIARQWLKQVSKKIPLIAK